MDDQLVSLYICKVGVVLKTAFYKVLEYKNSESEFLIRKPNKSNGAWFSVVILNKSVAFIMIVAGLNELSQNLKDLIKLREKREIVSASLKICLCSASENLRK